MIDRIVGLASLPVAIFLFLNLFGVLNMNTIAGLDILLIAAIVHILVQVSNVIGAHISDENVILSYVIHGIVLFPSFIYFVSLVVTLPAAITTPLLPIFASFIFMEGVYSFFF